MLNSYMGEVTIRRWCLTATQQTAARQSCEQLLSTRVNLQLWRHWVVAKLQHQFCDKMGGVLEPFWDIAVWQTGPNKEKWHFQYHTLLCSTVFRMAFGTYESRWSQRHSISKARRLNKLCISGEVIRLFPWVLHIMCVGAIPSSRDHNPYTRNKLAILVCNLHSMSLAVSHFESKCFCVTSLLNSNTSLSYSAWSMYSPKSQCVESHRSSAS